jgi:hypothetical protein
MKEISAFNFISFFDIVFGLTSGFSMSIRMRVPVHGQDGDYTLINLSEQPIWWHFVMSFGSVTMASMKFTGLISVF